MFRKTFFKTLLVGISITAILISPYAIAKKTTDKLNPEFNENQEIESITSLAIQDDYTPIVLVRNIFLTNEGFEKAAIPVLSIYSF